VSTRTPRSRCCRSTRVMTTSRCVDDGPAGWVLRSTRP
jgi:hypothetical protein